MYATYDYYTGTYGGGTIPPERFNYFIREAGAYADYITFNRIKGLVTIPEEVKHAVCAIADNMFVSTDGTGIVPSQLKSSESVGDYQVSYQSLYQSQTTISGQMESRYYQVAKKYLAHTGLLYRGIS